MKRLGRVAPPVAFATLIVFWSATIQPAITSAQQADEDRGELVQARTPPRPSAASADYDADALRTLSDSLADRASEGEAEPDQAPPAPSDASRALAAGSGGTEVSAQASALPAGSGTMLGMGESFTAQLSSGTASFGIPFSLPTARGGVQPWLDLSYSSAGGFGVAGVGWSTGSSAISRQSDRGLPQYDDRGDWHPSQGATLSQRYTPRWYLQSQTLDAAARITRLTTGATLPELLGADGTSAVSFSYSKRGRLIQVDSSYGRLAGGPTAAQNAIK